MALVLTIPGVVDSQDLHSLHAEPDGVSFELTFEYDTTAIEVMKKTAVAPSLPPTRSMRTAAVPAPSSAM